MKWAALCAALLASSLARGEPPKRELACGAQKCGADEYCDDRYKGHATDEKGRPLKQKQCMPLPAECRARPTCACVKKHVSFRRCSDQGGRVSVDDYPI
jgi:hypothetical protein